MQRILCLLACLAVTGAAQAQIKCWNDANGKRMCGDTPPAGAKVKTIETPAAPPAPAAKGKGPGTPAEQEQAFRKRQADAQKAADKGAEEERKAAAKKDSCNRAREAIAQLESGQRIARTDSKGERYFLDESQTAAELTKARQVAKDACN